MLLLGKVRVVKRQAAAETLFGSRVSQGILRCLEESWTAGTDEKGLMSLLCLLFCLFILETD